MAMIDYGAIAFKNGKCIQTDMFTPMIDMVGWEDSDKDYDIKEVGNDIPLCLKGNYFAYIGDRYLTVAFYKTHMEIVLKDEYAPHQFTVKGEWFGDEKFKGWKKWVDWGYTDAHDEYHIKVTKRNGYYVCKMKYLYNKYKVYFGCGVDYGAYKKWHIVNYYRCPSHLWRKFKWWVKNKVYDWRYYR